MGLFVNTCQKPGCQSDATKTYSDDNGNTLYVCENHYYTLVSGGVSL